MPRNRTELAAEGRGTHHAAARRNRTTLQKSFRRLNFLGKAHWVDPSGSRRVVVGAKNTGFYELFIFLINPTFQVDLQ